MQIVSLLKKYIIYKIKIKTVGRILCINKKHAIPKINQPKNTIYRIWKGVILWQRKMAR